MIRSIIVLLLLPIASRSDTQHYILIPVSYNTQIAVMEELMRNYTVFFNAKISTCKYDAVQSKIMS